MTRAAEADGALTMTEYPIAAAHRCPEPVDRTMRHETVVSDHGFDGHAMPDGPALPQADRADADAPRRVRVAIVTNIPAPYRLPMYDMLAATPGIELRLFFCSGREPDREWDLGRLQVPQVFLRERLFEWRGRYIHANPDIWPRLREFSPEVVVTTGFNPTHLLAFAYARLHGARHVPMTDGTVMSESRLSVVHRWIRRLVYRLSAAYVGASEGSLALYRQYGVPQQACFKSQLCADNPAFAAAHGVARDFDFIFCGRFVAGKLPLFAIEVAADTARRLGRRVRLLLVGSGELDERMRIETDRLALLVDACFTGFARQAELPGHYARARILLFPTVGDTWGVVANEACAAGLAVIVSPQAGVAGDLVRDGFNGHVLPLETAQWARAAAALLSDTADWTRMSANSLEQVRPYTYAHAARGLADAVAHATEPSSHEPPRPLPARRVVLIQRRLTHYRVPLFTRLRTLLARHGVQLELIHGSPLPAEALKGDEGRLSWARQVRCRYAFKGQLCWQWVWPQTRKAALVIVTQESRLLVNLLLQATRPRVPLALWGHGKNFQSPSPNGPREQFKRWLVPRADWWFAYTEASAEVVRETGFPPDRITVVNNAIDTEALHADLQAADGQGPAALRRGLGLGAGPVALVLGSLHADKQLSFVIQAARAIRRSLPDFELLIVGDGPDRGRVESAARAEPWVHWLGVRKGIDKACCLRVSDVMLNPFAVGLVVLDSFVAGVPLVVTDRPGHGPEFAYLRHGVNCVFARAEPEPYAADVVALLRDAALRSEIARGARRDANGLTLERMAERFCEGIVRCIARGATQTSQVGT